MTLCKWLLFLTVTAWAGFEGRAAFLGEGSPGAPAHVSVKPLDLSRAPSTPELVAAGQLGGPLTPTRVLADKRREAEVNLDFGRAIDLWNRHAYRQAVERFRAHVVKHPDSPWAAEADLHIACDATYNQRYSEAESLLTGIMSRHASRSDQNVTVMLSKARQRLAIVKMAQNNWDEAKRHFMLLNQESPDWRHRTYAAHWLHQIRLAEPHKLALLNCGARALAQVLERQGRAAEAREVAALTPRSLQGFSLSDLSNLSASYGLDMQAVQLQPGDLAGVEVPAVLHIPARNGGDSGHYWLLERIEGERLALLDPQSGNRFRQTVAELAAQWSGKVLVFARTGTTPGARLTLDEMQETRGGCCGAPRKEDGLGNPARSGVSGAGAPGR
ncbi:MAG: cysteine peptidase family C39 domain-containing protein [Verrucomicrobia bacterium]|nr:cysteine peptidase family C39 domain-containing protein [Verrucomicrobiota bacterium]